MPSSFERATYPAERSEDALIHQEADGAHRDRSAHLEAKPVVHAHNTALAPDLQGGKGRRCSTIGSPGGGGVASAVQEEHGELRVGIATAAMGRGCTGHAARKQQGVKVGDEHAGGGYMAGVQWRAVEEGRKQ
eukprot:scaffold5122_cov120-Isochrysis_galbana.AAC.4